MSNNQSGRYVIRNGIKTQVQAPTKDRFREVYSEEEEARDTALVEQVIDALRALEKRAEELKPSIANDPDNALPELAGRWKTEGFPKVGLAMLHHMMSKGSRDLLGAASAWEAHRNDIKGARAFYPVEYPNEPLRLALWEHGVSRLQGFPASSSSATIIDECFSQFSQLKTVHFGENYLAPNDKNKQVKPKAKEERNVHLASLFFTLYRSDPKYTKDDSGYEEAAIELAKQGIHVSGKTLGDAVKKSKNSIFYDLKAWGVPVSTIRGKKKAKD
ncbi:hypothetical protein AAGW18_01985 [Vreelandella titanicae]|uniref:hypothetical protein n=1 Tax=Vreelandella titanicae TaxID=664683 RepID=UPI0031586CD4